MPDENGTTAPADKPENTSEVLHNELLDSAYTAAVSEQLASLPHEEAAFHRREALHRAEHWLQPAQVGTHPLTHAGRFLRAHRYQLGLALAGSAIALGLAVAICNLFLPRPLQVSFARSTTCAFDPVLFPAWYTSQPGATFRITHRPAISVFHKPLFSFQACITATQPLRPASRYTGTEKITVAGLHLHKTVVVATGSYPAASVTQLDTAAMPLAQPLRLQLSKPDALFGYAVSAGGQTAPCTKHTTTVTCSVEPLKLRYGTDYDLTVSRTFHGHPFSTVLREHVRTISAVGIRSSSIAAGSVRNDKPHEITLATTKPVRSLGHVSLQATVNGAVTTIPASVRAKGSTITVNFSADLPRRAVVTLAISQVTATDYSQLEQPYNLTFTTSGGPKVSSTNLPSSGVSLRPLITLTFDQPLLAAQESSQLVSVSAGGIVQPIRSAVSGSTITLSLVRDLPFCTPLRIQVGSTVQSVYNISGDSTWTYDSRTICYTTFSIGNSVRGRPLTAYRFGSGSSLVVYIGAMHGSEVNSYSLLQAWIQELDTHPEKIPASRTIVVIPAINPDGVASRSRLNAHGIDLNRNFPANSWQSQVTLPTSGGAYSAAGGPYPLSEPESQALANYVQAKHPRLVLSYHSHAALINANDVGDVDSLGDNYARQTGYKALPNHLIGNFFDYTTTGAFEDWMEDKLSLEAMVIELRSSTATEFTLNRPAMWTMAQITP